MCLISQDEEEISQWPYVVKTVSDIQNKQLFGFILISLNFPFDFTSSFHSYSLSLGLVPVLRIIQDCCIFDFSVKQSNYMNHSQ